MILLKKKKTRCGLNLFLIDDVFLKNRGGQRLYIYINLPRKTTAETDSGRKDEANPMFFPFGDGGGGRNNFSDESSLVTSIFRLRLPMISI